MPPPPPPPPPPLGRVRGGVGPDVAGRRAAGARRGMRIVARFLDGVILGRDRLPRRADRCSVATTRPASTDFGGDAELRRRSIWSPLIGVAIAFVWDAVLTRMFGGTPMKLAFGMRVVRADNGQQVEWSHAITRWAIPGAFALIPIAVLSGCCNVDRGRRSASSTSSRKPLRQAVWDQVAKTLVVRRRLDSLG